MAVSAKPKYVEVTWVDSYSLPDHHWLPLQEVLDSCAAGEAICVSAGILVHRGEGMVAIATSLTEKTEEAEPEVAGTIIIPEVAIKKIRYLK